MFLFASFFPESITYLFVPHKHQDVCFNVSHVFQTSVFLGANAALKGSQCNQ